MSWHLVPEQIVEVAQKNRIEPALLQALIDVESSGSGFLPDGQVKILYERHILWRRLQIPGRNIDPRPLTRAYPNLCGRFWKPKQYPYGPSSSQWDKVNFVTAWAQKYDPGRWESYKKATYESCSWGLFQVMGFHYEAAGFDTVYDFKHANEESEQRQLEIALRWMDHNGLVELLRKKDWTAFVRRYNGSGQVEAYRSKLIAAYQRYLTA